MSLSTELNDIVVELEIKSKVVKRLYNSLISTKNLSQIEYYKLLAEIAVLKKGYGRILTQLNKATQHSREELKAA